MKRALFLLITATALSLAFSGCRSKPDTVDVDEKIQDPDMAKKYKNAPAWVFTPKVEGKLAGMGIVKMSKKGGMQVSRPKALAAGRDDLAQQINVKAKGLIEDFIKTTGIGDDETIDAVYEKVSQQVYDLSIKGATQEDMWISPDSDLHVLVVLNPDRVKDLIQESVETSYKNDRAAWQDFQAQRGHEKLQNALDKEFGD